MEYKLFLIGGTNTYITVSKSKKQIFEQYPLLYREKGSATRIAMEDFIANKDLPTRNKMELTSNEALKQAVIAGLGVSIMLWIGLKNELRTGDLKIIPFKGLPIVTSWNLVWFKNKRLSPTASAYLDFISVEKDRIIKENFDWCQSY